MSHNHDDSPTLAGHHSAGDPALGWDGNKRVGVAWFDYESLDAPAPPSDFMSAQADGLANIIRWFAEADTIQQAGQRACMLSPIGKVVRWITTSDTVESAGLKAITLSYVVRPDLFRFGSMSEVAEHYGVTRQAMDRNATWLWRLSNQRFIHGALKYGAEVREQRRHIARKQHEKP